MCPEFCCVVTIIMKLHLHRIIWKSCVICVSGLTCYASFTLTQLRYWYIDIIEILIYWLFIYRNSTQCSSAPQVIMNAVPQCSGWFKHGNTSTATQCYADAVENERSFITLSTNSLYNTISLIGLYHEMSTCSGNYDKPWKMLHYRFAKLHMRLFVLTFDWFRQR